MYYNPQEIEPKWQKYWEENQTFSASNTSEKPKFYVLDMFPYPSGAGLHVGHPLGYIASDIIARYKRHKGFNVLHPQGYDSFGLPAEQYAITTGQHPEITTKENINRYRAQLDKMGFSFDWNREIRTSNTDYYKWTQWIFIQLFNSYYCKDAQQARPIVELIEIFAQEGNSTINAETTQPTIFTASQWQNYSEKEKSTILLNYRLSFLAEAEVNWCAALGTVLANDEVINGLSERGGYPVVRKKMTQWMMRITAYADRLLTGLETIDWQESIKETQRNWIGKSIGATIKFHLMPYSTVEENKNQTIEVFTTRPDTIFGVTFITLAPEHELVTQITTPKQKAIVTAYIEATAKRSERDRMADVKTISGAFTGAFAIHPFTKESIPIWIGDYVLASYGTAAVMAVPAGDERDYAFASFFKGQEGMPEIKNIFNKDISEQAFSEKTNFKLINSDFLTNLTYKDATSLIINQLEAHNCGKGKTNYRLRDAVFSRQRYWGEPVPIYFKNGIPTAISAEFLPLELPKIEKYLPTETGAPPLGRAENWAWDEKNNTIVAIEKIDHQTIFPLELNTMPGWAGSSWYWLRYMDAKNDIELANPTVLNYWENVDLYIGGSEHATGHLLYSRFWNKFLKDIGLVTTEEPFKKLINQGMILGNSAFVYRLDSITITANNSNSSNVAIENNSLFAKDFKKQLFVSFNRQNDFSIIDNTLVDIDENYVVNGLNFSPLHVDLSCINDLTNELIIEKFIAHPLYSDYKNATFILENGKYIVGREVEKMSKSKYNVLNPDDICEEYGADCLRMYEMFLGPLEQSKPWNTQGLVGVFGFLKKFWKLFHPENSFAVSAAVPTAEELKILHQTIKKITEDIEHFSFNTSVATFMIATNELGKLKSNKRTILEPLCILLSPYAPHITEELWQKLGHQESISTAIFPDYEEKYLVENTKEYPVSFNGKMKFKINLDLSLTKDEIQAIILNDPRTHNQLQGRIPKQVIIVPAKIINIVL